MRARRQYSDAQPHLYQHVGCIVEAHDQRSHPGHVVHVGEGDEGDGGQVVQEHDQKILGTARDGEKEKEGERCLFEEKKKPHIAEVPASVHVATAVVGKDAKGRDRKTADRRPRRTRRARPRSLAVQTARVAAAGCFLSSCCRHSVKLQQSSNGHEVKHSSQSNICGYFVRITQTGENDLNVSNFFSSLESIFLKILF